MPGSQLKRVGCLVSLAAIGATLSGCPEPATPDPCEDDLLACAETPDFELDSDCSAAEQMGDLQVVLGEGEKTFVALDSNRLPFVYRGAQGGQHMLLGARVDNANPGRERALVEFTATVFEDQVAGRSIEISSELWEEGGSGLEIYGLLVLLGYWAEEGMSSVRVDVTDACGRTGFDEHLMME